MIRDMDLLLEVRQYSQLVRVPELYETLNPGDLLAILRCLQTSIILKHLSKEISSLLKITIFTTSYH